MAIDVTQISMRTASGLWRLTTMLLCLLCAWSPPAYPYRPFNSTDAAVAARGEMETECGPFGYVVDADGHFLVVPSAILLGVSARLKQ